MRTMSEAYCLDSSTFIDALYVGIHTFVTLLKRCR